ncbi:hypothetical protein WJX72_005800 [[Myrmecia] bisecta]|uniref:UBZ4-type domain-containing protein n=1 Tax=[Myrmecia] bisecta TaxID=41462 RepID=A0AAW1PKP7_9CHLO
MDGQRSAFALLQQAAKRRTPGSRGKQAGSSSKKQKSQPVASAFMPCPVCQASVPKALITSHVNSCLEVPPAPSQLSTPQAGNTAGKGTPGSTALELSAEVSCAKLGLTGAAAGQKMAVRLATNVAPSDEVSWSAAGLASNCAGPDGRFRGSPGVLKSALQKNVRLCRAGSAVRCALHLIKEDAAEFLRRCSIICLEDAVLHPDLPLLCGQPGLQATWEHRQMQVVHVLTQPARQLAASGYTFSNRPMQPALLVPAEGMALM